MANLLVNGGFETPDLGGTDGVPTGATWVFTGFAAVACFHGAYASTGNDQPPEGVQMGYVQINGSIAQTFTVASSGPFLLTFQACQRGGNVEDFAVQIDGVTVAVFTPQATFSAHTVPLTLASGSRVLKFLGLNTIGGDNTAFIDAVSIDSGGPGAVPVMNGQTIAITDSSFVLSPYATYLNGGYAWWNSPGNYGRHLFTGRSGTLLCSTSSYGQLPVVAWRVDNQAWTYSIGQTAIDLTKGSYFDDHLHSLEWVVSYLPGPNLWNPPPDLGWFGVRAIQIDTGATVAVPTRRTKNMLYLGDSFMVGVNVDGTANTPDALQAFSWHMTHFFDAEFGIIASPGQGYNTIGSVGFPNFSASWDHYCSGVSRLVSGLFSPLPDGIYLAMGNNDSAGSPLTTTVTTVLNGMLAAGAKFILHQDCPFTGGAPDASIQSAITAVASSKVPHIMLPATIGFATFPPGSTAGDHPTAGAAQFLYAPRAAAAFNAAGFAGSTTTTISSYYEA